MTTLREAAQFALDALHCPGDSELMDRVEQKLRAALAEQPAEQESMAVACQISALGDSWADFPLERAQEAIEHGLNVRYLGVLRQKPVKPAEQEPVAHENSNGVVHAAGYPWSEKEVLRPLVYGDTSQKPANREPLTDEELALSLLETLFDAYENGVPCYEDPENGEDYVGQAFRLDDETFHACADLLNRRRPRAHGIGGQV